VTAVQTSNTLEMSTDNEIYLATIRMHIILYNHSTMIIHDGSSGVAAVYYCGKDL